MAKLINIDAFLPDDIELRWRGQAWKIPGDVSVETVLVIQKGFEQLDAASKANDPTGVQAAFNGLAEHIAGVLAIRQPDKAVGLKFGARELGVLAVAILGALDSKAEEQNDTTQAPAGESGNVGAAAGN